MRAAYTHNGYYLVEQAIAPQSLELLLREVATLASESNNYGVRDLMNKLPAIRHAANSAPLITIARDILGANARPVRSVFFDKVPGANWNVAWHQDTSIALTARHEMPGFGPWSEKHGVVHVEPPEEYLANTLTLRVHLDTANSDTGVLRVVPGTHKDGRVGSSELLDIVARSQVIECNAAPGDVLLMSPLLFHSSRKARVPSHRRIIHIEYSAMELPAPLQWYE
ncbi:MAG TPA: phytanoyl-CoA dioxygenase family protein [Gammaproteobacteria bacterium]